jgi:WD40 repeat protein
MSILEIDNRGRRFEYDANDPLLRTFNDDGQQFFDGFHHLSMNPELGLLAIAGDREVRICDPDHPQTADHLIPLPVPHWHARLAWAPDNRSLLIVYVVHRKTRIQVYDLQRQQTVELPPIMGCNEPVLAWDPTSTKVAIGGREAEIHILNLAAVKQRTTLIGHSAPIRELSWSPSGTRIASCAYDGTVRIWDAAHGDQLAVFHPPEDSMIVHSVQWSPDGRRLAVGGASGEVYLLDAGPAMSTIVSQRTFDSTARHEPSQR